MSATAILTAGGVGKSYQERGLLSALCASGPRPDAGPPGAPGSAPAERTSALDGVDIELQRGGSLGIIGRNGAGKSTLLRLIAGVSKPSRGRLVVRGRVRSLLDLGAGFIEEMSGRENALMLLALDDLAPDRRTPLCEAALAFAGLGAFAEEPVRTYSAGMRLRLAYAVAIAIEPDILVADEVLAVGDEEFQRRCSQHVRRFLDAGGTLVLASHSLYLVEKLCREALWLEGGRVAAYGPSREVTAAYRAFVEEREASAREDEPAFDRAELPLDGPGRDASPVEQGSRGAPEEPKRVRLGSARQGMPAVQRVAEGAPLEVDFGLPAKAADDLRVEIRRPSGACVATAPLRGSRLRIAACPLLPGHYRLRVVDRCGASVVGAEVNLDCVGSSRELGSVRLTHRWT